MKLCKPRFQNYSYLLWYPSMGLILDSSMFIKKQSKVLGRIDTFFWWLQKFKMCFSQNLLFGFITLLNSVDDISSQDILFFFCSLSINIFISDSFISFLDYFITFYNYSIRFILKFKGVLMKE